MRKFKKIKLLTTLSSIGLVATSVPIIATSCTTSSVLYGPNPNDTTIEITQIRWVKQKIYNFNTESEIISKVKKDNRYIYSNYPGLEEATTVSAEIVGSNTINITISVTDETQTKYIQSGDPVSWSATYVAPTSKTDISTLNWKMRAIYDSTTNFTVDKNIVINTIKADNTDDGTTSKGAGIPTADWNNNKILVNVDIDGNNVSIVVTAAEGDSTYKGSTKWTAITDIIEDWSGEITTTFNGTRVLRVLRQGHQVTFACAISSSSELTSGQTKIIVNLPFTILEWNPTPAYIFNDWTIAGTVYVNLIGTHCLALKPLQTIAANTQIDFTLTCIIK